MDYSVSIVPLFPASLHFMSCFPFRRVVSSISLTASFTVQSVLSQMHLYGICNDMLIWFLLLISKSHIHTINIENCWLVNLAL